MPRHTHVTVIHCDNDEDSPASFDNVAAFIYNIKQFIPGAITLFFVITPLQAI